MLHVLRTIITQCYLKARGRGLKEKHSSNQETIYAFPRQNRAGGFDAFFEATLHTDNNIVIPIENMLLIFNFLSSKVGRQRNCATQ